jgi:hypothetical protein
MGLRRPLRFPGKIERQIGLQNCGRRHEGIETPPLKDLEHVRFGYIGCLPDCQIQCKPFSNREALKSPVLRPFCKKIPQVEDALRQIRINLARPVVAWRSVRLTESQLYWLLLSFASLSIPRIAELPNLIHHISQLHQIWGPCNIRFVYQRTSHGIQCR